MSQIHFIGGEKGGVGKSVMARLLAQYWIDRQRPFVALDADASHGALLRHYGDYSQAVDLTTTDSADTILDRALGAERRVLVDLPAQSARALGTWLAEANVLSLARELGTPVTFWHVSDGGFASVGQLEKALDAYGEQASFVLVKNQARSKDFSQLDAAPASAKLSERRGRVMQLAELDAGAMYKIDGGGLSFWAGANVAEGDGALKPLERERVKLWLGKGYAALDQLGDVV